MKTENPGSKIQLTVQSPVSVVGATEWLINCLKYFVMLQSSSVTRGMAISTLGNL